MDAKNPRTGRCAGASLSNASDDQSLTKNHDRLEAQRTALEHHVREFFPTCEGVCLEHRVSLLKAREYAGLIRCKPIGEIARAHAADAQQAADHLFHDKGASDQALKLAVDYCRHLVQAAFLAEHLDPEVWG